MNWKDRFKNKTFLVSFTGIIISFIYQMLGVLGVVPSISQDQVVQLVGLIINILAGFGIVIDPTTPGITD